MASSAGQSVSLVITSPPPPSTHCNIDTIALIADHVPLILLQNITSCVSQHYINDISVLQTLSLLSQVTDVTQ